MASERDQEIFGLLGTMSQREIAQKYGLTQARISQIKKKQTPKETEPEVSEEQ